VVVNQVPVVFGSGRPFFATGGLALAPNCLPDPAGVRLACVSGAPLMPLKCPSMGAAMFWIARGDSLLPSYWSANGKGDRHQLADWQGDRHQLADISKIDIMMPDHGGELVQRYVVFYESADDVMSKAPPVYPRHLARLKEFRDRGDLLLVGTFGDPQAEGSMAVFGSREAAEEFVRDDPFVNEGVVKAWTLREWDEVANEI
jgi:uncharacterized protein